jgi:anti-sigma B factor antagonist
MVRISRYDGMHWYRGGSGKRDAMQIDTEENAGILIARVAETRIDASVAIRFKDTMRRIVADTQSPRIVLDLGQVDFLDSSGLGAIVSVMKLLPSGQRLELAALTGNVAKVLRLTRMDTIFPILAAAPGRSVGPAG